MKPKRHPSEWAKVIVFLDANMPNVRECGHDCVSNAKRMCLHRFGPRTWVCERERNAVPIGSQPGTLEKPFNRFKDLDVARWWINEVQRRWTDRKGIVRRKHYVLATHDVDFIGDVHQEYSGALKRGYDGPPLTFSGRMDPKTKRWVDTMTDCPTGKEGWIQAGEGKRAVRLQIFLVPGGQHDRIQDLRAVVKHCRQLRKTAPPRPHS